MNHTISFTIDAPSPQKAAALRTQAHALLDADADCTVVSSHSAKLTTTYRVVGVNTKTGEVVTDTIEAEDEQEARKVFRSPNLVPTGATPAT